MKKKLGREQNQRQLFWLMATLFCGIIYSTLSHAKIGPDSNLYYFVPDVVFGGVEGSGTWINTTPFTLNGHIITQSTQNFGGRFSGGALYFATQRFAMGAEGGWGYYGGIKRMAPDIGWQAKTTLSGYDVLFDMLYNFDAFGVFLNAGFMGQSQHTHVFQSRNFRPISVAVSQQISNLLNQTELLPELKVGGIYYLNNHLGITLAYQCVFGSALQDEDEDDSDTSFESISDNANATFSTVMLGINYRMEL